MLPYISIIIPTYNRKETLKKTLDSIYASVYKNFEIIIVDDCSNDDTQELLKIYECRYVLLNDKEGPGEARNIGVKHAQGEIIQFFDSDVIVPPNLLSLVYKYFQEDKTLDCLVGTYTEEALCKNFSSQFKNLFIRYAFINLPENPPTIHACVTSIKKDVFIASHGFDSRLTSAGIEDAKFGIKLASLGYKIKFDKNYSVMHLKCFSFFDLIKNDFLKGTEYVAILLEDKEFIKMIKDKNQPNANRNFAICIPMAFLSLIFLILFLFNCHIYYLLSSMFFLTIYIIGQYDFLLYLAKIKGWKFSLFCFPLLLINSYTFGFSVLFGILRQVNKY